MLRSQEGILIRNALEDKGLLVRCLGKVLYGLRKVTYGLGKVAKVFGRGLRPGKGLTYDHMIYGWCQMV